MLPGVFLGLSLFFQTYGLKFTSVTNSGFITALYVVMIPILGALFFKQKIKVHHIVFSLMAFTGMGFSPANIAQFAVSGGLFGIMAWLLLVLAPIAGYLRLPDNARTPQRRHALLVLVVGALVLGLPDTFLAAPMTLTIYVVLAAAVVGRSPRP